MRRGWGEGVSTPEGLCMSQVSYIEERLYLLRIARDSAQTLINLWSSILPISSSEVTYKIVTSSGVRGNYKLFSPHDF